MPFLICHSSVLEATLKKLRDELDVMASAHTKASEFFSTQGDLVEKFKKDQSVNKKGVEETLSKAQSAKCSQLSKTKQLEKTYVRRCQEKDSAEASLREIYTSSTAQAKEIEKARIKATKAEEEANKAGELDKSHTCYTMLSAYYTHTILLRRV
ncbi:proline-serine-threonine phosphatase-interacting protein 1 [Elysia marginata]|uniref:Proline-serine-threonine phosphatase-interacting protein 1 n=1 Tax=Elysia marginata TaxID=1093978 RepID=A0AAV4K0N7_9GAST|nr:proline-serine-threonine phosphatase-interacting protein 1 [Elysia marginata]